MKIHLKVTGMNCNHCVSMINKAIATLQADAKVRVDLTTQTVSVESTLSAEDLLTALDEAGYPATEIQSC